MPHYDYDDIPDDVRAEARAQRQRGGTCPECYLGGGVHAAGCPNEDPPTNHEDEK